MHFPRVATFLALTGGALGWEISIYNQQNCNSGSNFDYVRPHTKSFTLRASCCSAIVLFQLILVLLSGSSTHFVCPSDLVHLLRFHRAVRDSGRTDSVKHSMRILHQRRLQRSSYAMQDPGRRFRHLFQFQIQRGCKLLFLPGQRLHR